MRIAPLMTRAPLTGALRPVTSGLLRDAYLVPASQPVDLQKLLTGRVAPWSDSFDAAPDATTRAVETALTNVMRATTALNFDELTPERLPNCRARTHLTALRALWRDADPLPEALSTFRHILGADAASCLEPLPLLGPNDDAFADPVEVALAAALIRHHGTAAPEPLPPTENKSGALSHVQSYLGRSAPPIAPDDSLQFYGLRDARAEADFAAALAQSLLQQGEISASRDIGVLVPATSGYTAALAEAFDRVGLSLSGQPVAAPRDLLGELLSALLAVLEGPAARTALATLLSSPLMPWPPESGRHMAREVIDRGWSRSATTLTGPERSLFDAFRAVTSPEQLIARLFSVAAALPNLPLAPRVAAIRATLGDDIDWPLLHRMVAPLPQQPETPAPFVEGVSLFDADSLPWRPVRHLIVLGLSGANWPRPASNSPMFTESEIALIRRDTGLGLFGRQHHLARGLELFRRQLGAASDAATLLVPARGLDGKALSPSTGLALIAHLLGQTDPARLIRDLAAEPSASWPVRSTAITPLPNGGAPALPASGKLHLDGDLLRLREKDTPVPQSPSRLETLLYSPLAWLLDELGAKDRTWAPETLDVLILGSLIGRVLEDLFPAAAPLPDDATLTTATPIALDQAIASVAPWLTGPQWTVERSGLECETLSSVLAWARFLRGSGAVVLGNEMDLAGEHDGLLIAGRADTLLQLPDGNLLLIDHKRSGARGRRDRMFKAWDLQVALYRAMLQRPSVQTDLTRQVAQGRPPITGYHTTLDSTVLVESAGAGIPGAEVVAEDISGAAMAQLVKRVAEVGIGSIVLNSTGDAKRFDKDCGIKAYALRDNALLLALMLPEQDDEEFDDE
ncbi:PD-(D/E)XK nuclease family protein [Cypionkella sp.]|uniref:PD-(D/E)XK nuclease family protein n=1 Tax=Cypionkella sp. TaxID=2811411 RepID=UPI002AC9ABD9|nr:PD-(D/E)XK nuclease family protein [Cypionkella sp.]